MSFLGQKWKSIQNFTNKKVSAKKYLKYQKLK